MRSLFLRWGVAVVVGTLWGAVLSPRGPETNSTKTTRLVSATTRYAKAADNPMNL